MARVMEDADEDGDLLAGSGLPTSVRRWLGPWRCQECNQLNEPDWMDCVWCGHDREGP